MKPLHSVSLLTFTAIGAGFLLLMGNSAAQTNQRGRLFIPFLDPASQSNVTVTVSLDQEVPWPPEFTNSLSNTNLFTTEEQMMIREVLVKYKNVTTNSGPPGTILVDCYKTNSIAPPFIG